MTKKVYFIKTKSGYSITSIKDENDYEVLDTFDVPDNMFSYILHDKYLSGIRNALVQGIRMAKTGYERIPIREKILNSVMKKIEEGKNA
jgi:hypothetical protein